MEKNTSFLSAGEHCDSRNALYWAQHEAGSAAQSGRIQCQNMRKHDEDGGS
jgi:hypothetical protein